MLGLKIVTKCQLDLMQRHIDDLTEDNMRLRDRIEELTSNNKELYDECNLLRTSIQTNELKSLKDLYILKTSDYPCDSCNIETKNCRKLVFANQTICVIDKANVNSFRAKPKRNKK